MRGRHLWVRETKNEEADVDGAYLHSAGYGGPFVDTLAEWRDRLWSLRYLYRHPCIIAACSDAPIIRQRERTAAGSQAASPRYYRILSVYLYSPFRVVNVNDDEIRWCRICIHTYIHTCSHTYRHTYRHTYMHAY